MAYGYGIGILENALDVCMREKINGEYTLTFSFPANDEKVSNIAVENIIQAPNGQLFTIKQIETFRDGAEVMHHVSCEHVFFNLLNEWHEEILLEGETASEAMHEALNIPGIEHHLATVEPTTTVDYIDLTNTNPVEVINQVINQCGGELYRDNFTISLLNRLGQDKGVQFRYRKNLKGIQRTVNSRNLITRIIPLGEEDMDISTVNNGQIYLESQYINYYRRPFVAVVRWPEIDDEDDLKAKALEHLAKMEVPEVSYEVDIVELKDLLEYGSEAFEIGDDVRIMDEELGIDIKARIVEYNQYLFEPWRSQVVIANFQPGLETLLGQLQSTRKAVETIITPDNRVNTFWLDGEINVLKNRVVASGSYAQAQVIEGKGLIMENTNPSSPDYGAIYTGPGLLAIANARDTQGKWNWRTFGTGKGFTADEIVTGTVRGAQGKWNLNNGIFRLGNSDSDYKLMFDGADLMFSDDVRIQFKGDTGPQGAQGPQGNPGSYYAPEWVDATEIRLDLVASPRIVAGNAYLHDALIVGADGNNYAGISGVGTSADSIRFWAGSSDRTQAPFRVTQSGVLVATDAIINGDFYTYDENGNLVGKFATEGTGAGAGAFLQLINTKTGVEAFEVYADLSNGINQTFVDNSFSVRAGSGSSFGSINLRGGKAQIFLNSDLGWLTHPIIYQYDAANNYYPFVIGKEKAIFLTQNVGIGTYASNSAYKLDVNGAINATGLYINNTAGVSGTFKSGDNPQKTITVTDGIITGL
jgi:phage minor structural protein